MRSEFLENIRKASTVTELPLSKRNRRGQGYVNAGSYLLGQIYLLIAVWDRTLPKPGGTGALAKKAYEGGIPVIWLSTTGNHLPRLITDFDEKGVPIAGEADCTEGLLISVLKPIFDGPSAQVHHSSRSAQDALKAFYGEAWRPRCYFSAYDFLVRIATLQRPRAVIRARPFVNQCSDWDRFLEAAPEVRNLDQRLRQVLLRRFV